MAGSVGSEDGDIGFQIAPMVDVVFVLMLFFMASAGTQVVERELGINLPGGSGNRPGPPTTPIVIEISGEGQVSMNKQNYGSAKDHKLGALRDWLKSTIDQFGDKDPVIIRPSPDARQERIIDVLDAAAVSGVHNLSFG